MKSRRGFTLIELLTVMAIIAILVGITIGSMGYVQYKGAATRTSGEIHALEGALEKYKLDDNNGVYPLGASNSFNVAKNIYDLNPMMYTNTGAIVCTNLWGKDTTNFVSGITSYYEFNNSQIMGSPPNIYIIDPFGLPYGFSCGEGAYFNTNRVDIWSTGGKMGTKDTDTNRWIMNWR
jgi:prepilin-type N-terminal cleavage/methylation domain-containing protein